MKRTPLKKKSDRERTSKGLFDHLKKETKEEEWNRIKTEILFPYFLSIGLLNTCEIKGKKCVGNALPLHFAHSKKRDEIAKNEPERTRELCEVVRACPYCHDEIEYLAKKGGISGKQQMYAIVIGIIATRNQRLNRWKNVRV